MILSTRFRHIYLTSNAYSFDEHAPLSNCVAPSEPSNDRLQQFTNEQLWEYQAHIAIDHKESTTFRIASGDPLWRRAMDYKITSINRM